MKILVKKMGYERYFLKVVASKNNVVNIDQNRNDKMVKMF